MNIKDLAYKVPVDKIIAHTFRLKGNGRYLRGIEHDSLVIDLEKNRFYWNSLGISGSALDWLMKIKGMSYRSAFEALQKYSGLPFTRILDKIDEPTPIYPKLLDTFYNLGKHYREYWYRRGFTDETINYFKLGYTGKAYVIPVIVDGKLENFQCRIGQGDKKRIWNWAKDRTAIPFNVDHGFYSKFVFLTEGLPDAMIMHQIRFPAISQISGPYAWNKDWNKYIIGYDQCYVIYDNDKAGMVGARRTANKLLNRGYILFWPNFMPDKYDVNQCFLDYGEERTRNLILEVMVTNAIHSDLRWPEVWANKVASIRAKITSEARKIL